MKEVDFVVREVETKGMGRIFEDITVGEEIINETMSSVTKEQLVRYAGASGDFNPLHTDDATGKAAGFGGVIAQGMLMMGMAAAAVTNRIPKKSLNNFKVRFVGATRPGDVVKVTGKVTDKRIEDNKGIVSCALEVADQDDDIKVSGSFEAELPLEG